MANYGGVGWIDGDESDADFIRKDSYFAKGQLGTFDAAAGTFGTFPVGADGQVLTADPLSSFGLSWQTPDGENITAGVPAAQTGTSRLTIVDVGNNTTLAVAQTGVAAGTYGTAGNSPQISISDTGQITAAANNPIVLVAGVSGAESGTSGLSLAGGLNVALANSGVAASSYGNGTNVPQITVDARGRITAAVNVPITPAPPVDQLVSIPIRNFKAGSSSVVGAQDCTAVGDGAQALSTDSSAYGRNSRAGQQSAAYGSNCSVSAIQSVGYGAQITCPASNCAYVGYNISSIAQDNALSVGNVAVGAQLLGVLTQGSHNIVFGQAAFQSITTGSRNVGIGLNSGQTLTTGGDNTLVGVLADAQSSVNARGTAVGFNAKCITDSTSLGANCQSNGIGSLVAGYQSASSSVNGISLGRSATSSGANNCGAIGNNIDNTVSNSMLMGNNVNGGLDYVLRSTGYIRSRRNLSCAAGQIAGDLLQVFNTAGPTAVNLQSNRFDFFPPDGLSSRTGLTNGIFLGTIPQDIEANFLVQCNLEGTVTGAGRWTLSIQWDAPGVISTILQSVSMDCTTGITNNLSTSCIINVPAGSTGRNFVGFLMTRQNGTNFNTTMFRASVTRIN